LGLKIVIGDDGVGRQLTRTSTESGSGLMFHSTMLAVIGGTLSVEDRLGGGTRVVIEVATDEQRTSALAAQVQA
jgi:nitrate/nitrite-specific signal transduction histidine kinase